MPHTMRRTIPPAWKLQQASTLGASPETVQRQSQPEQLNRVSKEKPGGLRDSCTAKPNTDVLIPLYSTPCRCCQSGSYRPLSPNVASACTARDLKGHSSHTLSVAGRGCPAARPALLSIGANVLGQRVQGYPALCACGELMQAQLNAVLTVPVSSQRHLAVLSESRKANDACVAATDKDPVACAALAY